MGKTCKGKAKAAAKVARAKAKVARKCKGGKLSALLAAFALAFLCVGCASSESAQPAKANTMNNRFDDCIIVVATHASVSNRTVTAEGTKDIPAVELFTQTQSLESSGTESYAQTATQTPTTDVKPDVDLHYNDAVGKGGDAVSTFLSSLTTEGFAAVKAAVASKQSGKITVQTKDGKTETLDCEGGKCTTSGGLTITDSDCAACKDCSPQ
jgi:hypothetical protein